MLAFSGQPLRGAGLRPHLAREAMDHGDGARRRKRVEEPRIGQKREERAQSRMAGKATVWLKIRFTTQTSRTAAHVQLGKNPDTHHVIEEK